MSTLLPLEHLFFFLSRLSLPDGMINRAFDRQKSAAEHIDFSRLTDLALDNGTAGFMYKNIKNLQLFPAQLKQDLHTFYRRTAFHNLDQLSETLRLLKLLSVNNIKVIPLKGVVASEMIFHDLGVYPSSDIDILVHPDDLEAVKSVLRIQAGYSPVQGQDEEELLAGHYHYMFCKKQYLLEVHWNLTKRYFEVPPEFWWQGLRTVTWRGMDILELSPEKYLMYTVFRIFDHCFFPLRFLVLIAGILDQYASEIRWDTLMHDCGRFKMKRLVTFTLQLAHELLGAEIPAALVARKTPGYSALKKLCLSGMLNGIKRRHLRMMYYTSLLDSPVAVARVLLGRLTPSRGELCLRYNLPSDSSSKIFLYYLINPVLLFFKSSEKIQRR